MTAPGQCQLSPPDGGMENVIATKRQLTVVFLCVFLMSQVKSSK